MADGKAISMISWFLVSSILASIASAGYIFNGYRMPASSNTNNRNNYFGTNSNNINGFQQQRNNLDNTHNDNNNNLEKQVDGSGSSDSNRRCVQKGARDFRSIPGNCGQFMMCSGGILITFSCPDSAVYSAEHQICVRKGSTFDTCTERNSVEVFTQGGELPAPPASHLTNALMCPRGATYKKAHPVHCARYFDCSKPAMMSRWDEHEWECKYPFLFNEDTRRCEHYSMVSCGTRKIAYDRCEYKANTCNGHSHCRPCHITYPSCRNMADGMNVWSGRVPSPYYVVCADNRVVYSGACPGGQVFDGKTGTCVIQSNRSIWGS